MRAPDEIKHCVVILGSAKADGYGRYVVSALYFADDTEKPPLGYVAKTVDVRKATTSSLKEYRRARIPQKMPVLECLPAAGSRSSGCLLDFPGLAHLPRTFAVTENPKPYAICPQACLKSLPLIHAEKRSLR
jgi:hypothetical protein